MRVCPPAAGALRVQPERVNVSDTSTLTSGVAGRYATALFELAVESGETDTVANDLEALETATGESADLRRLLRSPLLERDEQRRALDAVAEAMELGTTVRNLLGLMASRRRLFALPEVIETYSALLAEHRGEVTAEVTAAQALSDAQTEALKDKLRAASGREVKLKVAVDPALIGGMVVKLGSRMIDTSIRSRLNALQNAMKEVG